MEILLWNEKRFVPYKVAALVEVLMEEGIAPEASLSGTGLSLEDLANPETRISVRQSVTVSRNALALSKTPETPFRTGSRIPLSAYGMYGFALVCSPTIREYFEVAVKFHQLATPLLPMSWREEGDYVSWIFPTDASVTYPDSLQRFLMEQLLTQLATHLRGVLEDDSYLPIRVALSYPAPGHTHLYKRYLGCPARFSQPMSELVYPRSILSAKPRMAHGLTWRTLQETCDRILGEVKTSTGIAGEVYQIIASTPGHSPSMEIVARTIGITVRTLNRKLSAEGTSFSQILDDLRCNLAKEYLRTTKLSLEDISELVGFSDAANFRHAFHRWTGSTPARFRS
jgi:AraC-like DNA-binding protein